MGMVDRGADLSPLSQYPHEREILVRRRGLELHSARLLDCPLPSPHARRLTPLPLGCPSASPWQFAPLTGIEVLRTRVEGTVLVVESRLSVNLRALTIEQARSPRPPRPVAIALSDLRPPSRTLHRLPLPSTAFAGHRQAPEAHHGHG